MCRLCVAVLLNRTSHKVSWPSSVLDINENGFTAQSVGTDLLRLDVRLLKSPGLTRKVSNNLNSFKKSTTQWILWVMLE